MISSWQLWGHQGLSKSESEWHHLAIKPWENKLTLCLDPNFLVYLNMRAFSAKQISQGLMNSFSGKIVPGIRPFQHKVVPVSGTVSYISQVGEARQPRD